MSASFVPIALCLFSAITVALANFAVKRGGDVLTARMVLSLAMAATVIPLIPFVNFPARDLWPLIFTSVIVHWLYQFAMIRALHRGDLSLVFPVMRGLGPLVTAVIAIFVLNEQHSPIAWLGLLAASGSIIVFAMPSDVDDGARKLNREALFWAGMTALGIGAYAVVDTRATRAAESPLDFIVWLFLLDWIGITIVTLWTRRGQVWTRVKPQLRAGLLGGFAGTLSYGAAIFAYDMMDASLVTALRETSVVFAAIFGAIFLKEGFGPRRIIAASVLASGLVLMHVA